MRILVATIAGLLFAVNVNAVTVDFESDITYTNYDWSPAFPGTPSSEDTIYPVRATTQGFTFGYHGTEQEWLSTDWYYANVSGNNTFGASL